MTKFAQLALLGTVLGLSSMAHAEGRTACQAKAATAALQALNLPSSEVQSGLDTGKAVIVTIISSSLESDTNPTGRADVTVYTPSRNGDDCEVGQIAIDIYNTNG